MTSTDLVPVEPRAVTPLFGSDDPTEILDRVSGIAAHLTDVVRKQKLSARISGRDYVLVEGWTTLGALAGVFPVTVWTRPLEDGKGWEARVEARTLDGRVVGAAEAMCSRDEKEWGPNPSKGSMRPEYALRSMAATRATSKALRGPLGFVVSLAGFQATPAEEMPDREEPVTAEQLATIDDLLDELEKLHPGNDWKAFSRREAGLASARDLTTTGADHLIAVLTQARIKLSPAAVAHVDSG